MRAHDDIDSAAELDLMLALAERELKFLFAHFTARREVAQSVTGQEFLEHIATALIASQRLRFEITAIDDQDAAVRAAADFHKRGGS